jgi:hypothetical protein
MPQTIGALQNVPAPGDPITSPWAIQGSGYMVHPFANAAAISAGWATAPNGSVAIAIDTGILYVRRAGIWRPVTNSVLFAGSGQVGDTQFTTTGIRVLFTFGPGATYPFPVTVSYTSLLYFGFSAGAVNCTGDMVRSDTGAPVQTAPNPLQAIAGAYQSIPLVASWTVAAGADPNYQARVNVLATGGGTVHCYGFALGSVVAG